MPEHTQTGDTQTGPAGTQRLGTYWHSARRSTLPDAPTSPTSTPSPRARLSRRLDRRRYPHPRRPQPATPSRARRLAATGNQGSAR